MYSGTTQERPDGRCCGLHVLVEEVAVGAQPLPRRREEMHERPELDAARRTVVAVREVGVLGEEDAVTAHAELRERRLEAAEAAFHLILQGLEVRAERRTGGIRAIGAGARAADLGVGSDRAQLTGGIERRREPERDAVRERGPEREIVDPGRDERDIDLALRRRAALAQQMLDLDDLRSERRGAPARARVGRIHEVLDARARARRVDEGHARVRILQLDGERRLHLVRRHRAIAARVVERRVPLARAVGVAHADDQPVLHLDLVANRLAEVAPDAAGAALHLRAHVVGTEARDVHLRLAADLRQPAVDQLRGRLDGPDEAHVGAAHELLLVRAGVEGGRPVERVDLLGRREAVGIPVGDARLREALLHQPVDGVGRTQRAARRRRMLAARGGSEHAALEVDAGRRTADADRARVGIEVVTLRLDLPVARLQIRELVAPAVVRRRRGGLPLRPGAVDDHAARPRARARLLAALHVDDAARDAAAPAARRRPGARLAAVARPAAGDRRPVLRELARECGDIAGRERVVRRDDGDRPAAGAAGDLGEDGAAGQDSRSGERALPRCDHEVLGCRAAGAAALPRAR